MIQDISPHKLHNEFRPGEMPQADSIVILFRKELLLADVRDNELFLPLWKDFPTISRYVYLFTLDETDVFLCLDEEQTAPEGYDFYPLRDLRRKAGGPQERMFAAYTAVHLYHWYSANRFCGSCGNRTVPAPDERAMDCPACGKRIYPRIQPAVIVGVTNGDSLLITRYADRPLAIPALVAGFAEIGETLEETVAREVMEETGLQIRNLRYYKSQPWGIADDLLAGFYCDVDGDPTVRLDRHELKEAVWIPRGQIEGQPDDFSLTNEMMMTFKAGREPRGCALPE
ncbi:MAG: NAD(+) diphosphatase [Blautia sp.]|nr:NAD(+) diphosphatase [Blautia sp.]